MESGLLAPSTRANGYQMPLISIRLKIVALALVVLGPVVFTVFRPLALAGLLLTPIGPVLVGLWLAAIAMLVAILWVVFTTLGSRPGSPKLPVVATIAFAIGLLLLGLPAQTVLSEKLGISVSFSHAERGSNSWLLIVNDDFGNNALPRPDTMILIDITEGRHLSLTPVLRDWTYSYATPEKTLAETYFGIPDCDPYCELKDLAARISLEAGNRESLSTQSMVVATVVSQELNRSDLRVIEATPKTIEQVITHLAPLELEVRERIPVGGKWVNESMSEIRYWIEPGVQELDSEQILWYARARWTSSNESRVQRQLELIRLALDRGPASLARAFLTSDGVQSNLSPRDLMSLSMTFWDVMALDVDLAKPIGG